MASNLEIVKQDGVLVVCGIEVQFTRTRTSASLNGQQVEKMIWSLGLSQIDADKLVYRMLQIVLGE